MTVLTAAQRFHIRPSEMLRLRDDYDAYCFDEACCYMLGQLEEGKRPFFQRASVGDSDGCGGTNHNGNSATVALLQQLGAEVKQI